MGKKSENPVGKCSGKLVRLYEVGSRCEGERDSELNDEGEDWCRNVSGVNSTLLDRV